MKRALLFVILATMLAATALGSASRPVLTSDGVLYTLAADPDARTLVLTARFNDSRHSEVVPATLDGEVESDGQLAYDRVTQTLYVVWRRGESSTEVVLSALNSFGQWSEPTVLSRVPGYKHSDLQIALTRSVSAQNEPVTFLQAIWWKESHAELDAEYGLAVLDGSKVLSTSVGDLLQLTGIRSALDSGIAGVDGPSPKPEPVPTYPPLAISPVKDGADVVFGSRDKKTLTRVTILPRQPKADARLWIPGGKSGTRVPYTKVHNALNGNGQAATYITGGKVVVYAAKTQFRYTTLENGVWATVRSIALDEAITPSEIANELRQSVEEQQ